MWGFFKKKAPVETKPSEILNTARAIVDQYDDHLQQRPLGFDIRDVRALPFEKGAILNALRLERSSDPREEVREFLTEIALKLAHFQSDIGTRDLSPMPPALADLPPEARDLLDMEKVMAAMSDHRPKHERYQALLERVTVERRDIAQRLQKDDQMLSEQAHKGRY